MSIFIGLLHFVLWGLTEAGYNKKNDISNCGHEKGKSDMDAIADRRVESMDADNRRPSAEQK
jgi:hypothetical protein